MTNYKKSVSRRKFLDTITTAALVVPFLGNSAVSLALPKKKLRHASIGVGGMGGHDLKHFGQHPDLEVVAICDVDEQNLLKAAELFREQENIRTGVIFWKRSITILIQ